MVIVTTKAESLCKITVSINCAHLLFSPREGGDKGVNISRFPYLFFSLPYHFVNYLPPPAFF